MNFKVIINILLVILVLHLLIKNFNYRKRISLVKYEKFEDKKEEEKGEKKSLEFLTDLEEMDFEEKFTNPKKLNFASLYTDSKPYKELVDYVNKCSPGRVAPGNYYVTDENNANFTSNVLNVHKFYDYNPIGEYDGQSELSPTTYVEQPVSNQLDKVSKQTCFNDRNTHDNTEIFKPDNWSYKDDVVMNGSAFMENGLVGFDSLESAYGSYGNNDSAPTVDTNTNKDCDIKQDDVRFGLGYPNKEYREVR